MERIFGVNFKRISPLPTYPNRVIFILLDSLGYRLLNEPMIIQIQLLEAEQNLLQRFSFKILIIILLYFTHNPKPIFDFLPILIKVFKF